MADKVIICTLPDGRTVKYRTMLSGVKDRETDHIGMARVFLLADEKVSPDDLGKVQFHIVDGTAPR
jgi:hypothetical protein